MNREASPLATGSGLFEKRPASADRRAGCVSMLIAPTIDTRRALLLVSLAAVLANSTWFSATAVIPALKRDWDLDPSGAAWLVVAVQLGFIAGNVGSALLNLADRIKPRRLIAVSAIAAGSANAGLLGAGGLAAALPARFLVGAALAGVYAPCVRLVASHFERARGAATAVVVGALTVGSGLPHLVRGVANVPWQATILATSALTVLAALAVHSVPQGPSAPAGTPPLDLRAAVRALRDPPLRMTTLGYMGHMWELYAVWAWLPTFFSASRTDAGRPLVGVVAFAAIGAAGFVGAVVAGLVADRVGRPATTTLAMLASAACCLASPVAFAAPTSVLVALLLVWGATVIADSAQFSAATTELAEPRYAGSALTLQLALGFALTIASIRLVPLAAGAIGWRYALVPLAAGPLAGALATSRLRGTAARRDREAARV